MTHSHHLCLVWGFLLLSVRFLSAQVQSAGTPQFSFDASLPTYVLPALNTAKAQAKERENPLYSLPSDVQLTLENAGKMTEADNGDRTWHLAIESPQGKSIGVFYEDFYLPPGAKLFMYDAKGEQIKGAYTYRNNTPNGKFFTGFIHAKRAIIEYYEPAEVAGEGHFTIFRIDQTVNAAAAEKNALLDFGFGTASECHVNAACAEGDDFAEERKGVCRVMMTVEEGTAWCTGTLLNNVRNDETPYVLSAFHCTDGYTPLYDLWRFDFQYAAADCPNPAEEPGYQSMFGCQYRAGRQATDFQLLEINQSIPSGYDVLFNGWDRSAEAPTSAVLLHHPTADIQKISRDNQPLIIHPSSINWNNDVTTPAERHFKATLDVGTFEIGSSGCAFFDENKRVTAQLHGGFPGCEDAVIYAGRLHYSWDEGTTDAEQLAPWLDPDGTGAEFTDALTPTGDEIYTISGTINNQNGAGVAGVLVRANGDDTMSTMTDETGNYSLELPAGGAYSVSYSKNYNVTNGVFTSDILKMRRVILTYEDYPDPYTRMAGDVNGTNSEPSTADIIVIRQLALNTITEFPNDVPSWRFVPAIYEFPDENNPWSEPVPSGIFVNDLQQNIIGADIIGIKTGDVNGSANPGE